MTGDPAALAATLGPLTLARARARRPAHHGRHPRRTSGAGDAFWQYRPLEPGESAAAIDWRKSARSDALLVREREREDPVRLLIWCDGSGSMDFASGRHPTKLADARRLTGALALAATAADERVGLLAGGPPGVAAILSAAGDAAPLPRAALGPGDCVVIAGDFLDGDTPSWVARAAAAGAAGVAIRIVDPAEDAFPFTGRTRFEPSEADEAPRDLARAEALRDDYLAAWRGHGEALAGIATTPGWTLVTHRTDADPAPALAAAAAWLRG